MIQIIFFGLGWWIFGDYFGRPISQIPLGVFVGIAFFFGTPILLLFEKWREDSLPPIRRSDDDW